MKLLWLFIPPLVPCPFLTKVVWCEEGEVKWMYDQKNHQKVQYRGTGAFRVWKKATGFVTFTHKLHSDTQVCFQLLHFFGLYHTCWFKQSWSGVEKLKVN